MAAQLDDFRKQPQFREAEDTNQASTFEQLLARESSLSSVSMGFDNAAGFALLQRAAKVLNKSSMVPPQYRDVIEKKDRNGNITTEPNPNGLANCIVALNMAARLKADPLMIMQNLYIVEGRPSWSSQYIIAAINSCGKFSPIRFDIKDLGFRDVEFKEQYWESENGRNVKKYRTKTLKVKDMECIAWVRERETGERLESTPITIEMAVAEGWYQKNGSKWQTMPGQMIRYRAAAFLGRIYAPELLMGLRTYEEELDLMQSVREITHAAEQEARESKKPTFRNRTSAKLADVTEQPNEPEPAAHVDDAKETLSQDVEGPTLQDALDLVEQGDVDMAREIARGLSTADQNQVEDAIQKLEAETNTAMGQDGDPGPDMFDEPTARTARSRRSFE